MLSDNKKIRRGHNSSVKSRNISAVHVKKQKEFKKAAKSAAVKQEKSDTEKIELEDIELFNKFSNPSSGIKSLIESEFDVEMSVRGNIIIVKGGGKNVKSAGGFIRDLLNLFKTNVVVECGDLKRLAKIKLDNPEINVETQIYSSILLTPRKKNITPRTPNQKIYTDAIFKNDIVISIGPAGTGKTYLAMACAVSLFQKKIFDRIILTRPAVEAGEKLGFLPGDIAQKINPYLRPLYDALYEMMEFEKVIKLIETDVIEVAPIAFMRGRTLNNSFIILDEAQNATNEQTKMMLTRIGSGSKIVINGDITQTDLPSNKDSGLITASKILRNISGIEVVNFDETDVLRHKLVRNIIKAYEKN